MVNLSAIYMVLIEPRQYLSFNHLSLLHPSQGRRITTTTPITATPMMMVASYSSARNNLQVEDFYLARNYFEVYMLLDLVWIYMMLLSVNCSSGCSFLIPS